MRNYIKTWNAMRALRLIIGLFILGQGILSGDWMFITLGGLFSLMPLLNIGCCGAASCDQPIQKNNSNVEDIHYEEVR